ncbi:MAG: hypothetical protein ACU0CN_05195, partial [Pseudooceanicola nanhaiensis]
MPVKALLIAPNAQSFADAIKALRPDAQISAADTADEAIPLAGEAEVLITMGSSFKPELIAAMPKLKWIQALSAGTDHIQRVEGLPDVPLTSLSGAHGPQMTELAILLMLALPRNLRKTLEN